MSVKKDLLSGTFYIAVAKYSGLIISLIVTAVLSRILTPEDYGLVAIATVFIIFFNILSDIGIGPAIIQNKDLTDEDYINIFSYTVYLGIGLASIFFLISPLISDIYQNPELLKICKPISLVILFSCINILPTNILYKNKRFALVSFTNLIVQLILGVISILVAYRGAGVYSLLISPIFSPLALFVVYNYFTKIHFVFNPKLGSLKKIFAFSIYQFFFNIVNYFSRNSDKLLVGKVIGLNSLGYYEKSYRLMMLPLQNIAYIISPVLHPIFSDFQNDYKLLAEKYCKVINILAYVGFTLTSFLFFSATQLIVLIFGNQWLPSVMPFKILALSVGIQIITSSTGPIFQAANATKRLFYTGLVVSSIMVLGFIVAALYYKSLIAFSYAFLLTKTLDFFISYYSLFKKLNYPLRNVVKMVAKPLFCGGVVFIALWILSIFNFGDNYIYSLSLNIIVYGIFTLISIQLCGEHNILKMLTKIKNK